MGQKGDTDTSGKLVNTGVVSLIEEDYISSNLDREMRVLRFTVKSINSTNSIRAA